MKHQSLVFALFLGSMLVAEVSCGSNRTSRPEDDDDDGGNASSSSGGGGDSSSSSSGVGGAGGSIGMCAEGGEQCSKASDCCNGLCDINVCAFCSGAGQACGQGCCEGLTCNAGACSSCKGLDQACSVGGDCCSKNCQFGACVPACSPVGSDCFQSSDCCSGICSGGVCQSESCVTCSEYFLQGMGTLCPDSQILYEDAQFCICPLCGDVCASACDQGGPPSPDCQNCAFSVGSTGGPCEMQFMACANDT